MTSLLKKVRLFIREEAPYCLILSGVLLFHTFSSLYIFFHPAPPTPQASESSFERAERILSAEPERVKLLLEKDPNLQLLGGFLFLFSLGIFVYGLFLNVRFWSKQHRGEWEYPWRLLPPRPAWGLRDVFRISILLVFIAYLVEILQGVFLLFLKMDLPDQVRLMVNTTFLDLVTLGMVFYWVVVQKNQSLRGLGFSAKHFGRHVAFALSSYAALLPLLAASLLVSLWASDLIRLEAPEQPLYDVFFGESYQGMLGLAVFLVVLVGPIVEETFFRGFLYNALKRQWGKGWAIATSGVFFAALHATWTGFLPIALLGVTLAYVYEVTATLVASIALHALHNALVMGFVFIMRDLLQRLAGG